MLLLFVALMAITVAFPSVDEVNTEEEFLSGQASLISKLNKNGFVPVPFVPRKQVAQAATGLTPPKKLFDDDPLAAPIETLTVEQEVNGRAQDFMEAFKELDDMADDSPDNENEALEDSGDDEDLSKEDPAAVFDMNKTPEAVIVDKAAAPMVQIEVKKKPSEPISGGFDTDVDPDSVINKEAGSTEDPSKVVSSAQANGQQEVQTKETASSPAPSAAKKSSPAAQAATPAAAKAKKPVATQAQVEKQVEQKALKEAKNDASNDIKSLGSVFSNDKPPDNSGAGATHRISLIAIAITMLAVVAGPLL